MAQKEGNSILVRVAKLLRISIFMPPLFVECGRALSVAHVRPSVCPCVLPFVHQIGRYFVSATPPTIFSQSF